MGWFRRDGMIAAGLALFMGLPGAAAQEPLDGFVIARKACDATPSIRNAASEGGTQLTIDRAYRLIGENRRGGGHFQIEMPGAEPARRWIAKDCGLWVQPVDPADDGTAPACPETADGTAHRDLLLAISWQPGFCETRPGKRECRSQTEDRFDADHLTLHGLWPQPRGTDYCGVAAQDRRTDEAGRWSNLAPLSLTPDTRAALDEAMPGTRSALDRHEWLRHGTCYRAGVEEYFADSLLVLAAINASPVRDLFAGSIGGEVTQAAVRGAFDTAFGEGAGDRVRIACANDDGRRIVTQLTIGLVGEIAPDADIGALIRAAPPTDGGCPAGIVDAVGLQ
ncbi:ribonuclease [Aurantimonas sp. A2-1-M11]|uniref:ribonuclease T2 family protein n=1 Tax=Aurantimonas sp. A2-1-M11 TaxID=3113712 RepID=UPI002F9261A7